MQGETSICSRITWFAISTIILVETFVMGLRVLPAFEGVFADLGIKLPTVTQAVFTFGPLVLATVGVIAAVLIVLGEFTPALRGARTRLMFLVLLLIGASIAAVFTPRLNCVQLVSPSAPASCSPGQPENAP